MIRETILVVLLYLIGGSALSQTVSINLNGTVTSLYSRSKSIEDVDVIISKGTDTLARLKSDVDGKFSYTTDSHVGDVFKLTTRHKNYVGNEVSFKVQTEFMTTFHFELDMMKISKEHWMIYPKYELNELEKFTGFDVEMLKEIIAGYPLICIEFTHYRNPDETELICTERLKLFKEFLVLNGVPMNNIRFNSTSETLYCSSNIDCKAEINGMVISLEGNCD